jgi:hypothetical protein
MSANAVSAMRQCRNCETQFRAARSAADGDPPPQLGAARSCVTPGFFEGQRTRGQPAAPYPPQTRMERFTLRAESPAPGNDGDAMRRALPSASLPAFSRVRQRTLRGTAALAEQPVAGRRRAAAQRRPLGQWVDARE